MKLGLISLGGYSSRTILKKAKDHFTKINHIDIKNTEVHTTNKGLKVLCEGKELEQYDCLYIRGSFKYALLQEAIASATQDISYLPLKQRSFSLGHNKFLTALELQKIKIPIPTTYLAATVEGAKKLLEQVNYPIIMKIPSGTHGKGVMFADSVSSAKSILDTLEVFKQPFIIQEYIETGATDIRAFVLGDKVIAAMKRKALDNELRANIHMGGIGVKYKLDPDTEEIAVKAARTINADICAVDILEGKESMVIEINLSPSIRGITQATKKDISGEISKFLKEKTKEFSKEAKEKTYKEIIKTVEIESKSKEAKEMISNLNIKAGVIKLPEVLTKITGFKNDDEVTFVAKGGRLLIKKYEE